MQADKFVAGALRTECAYGPVEERVAHNPYLIQMVLQGLEKAKHLGEFQNELKKAIFYGKGKFLEDQYRQASSKFSLTTPAQTAYDQLLSDRKILRLLHAFLGMLTEAAELQEHLLAVLSGKTSLDLVNVAEETGDAFWYPSITSDVLGMPFGQIFDQNIAKLRARYPEKFTEDDANCRDLDKERKTLESGMFQPYSSADAEKEQLVIAGLISRAQISAGTLHLPAIAESGLAPDPVEPADPAAAASEPPAEGAA